MRNLAFMYRDGRGVPKDAAMAFALFVQAADKGDSTGSAHRNVAWCYETGFGTDADLAIAAEHYRRAAELGEAYAKQYLKTAALGSLARQERAEAVVVCPGPSGPGIR